MRKVFSVIIVLALTACGSDGDPTGSNGNGGGTATNIAAVSGGSQRVAAGVEFLAPLVVRVTNAQGGGVSGVTVAWSVTAGGATLSSNTTTSGGNGETSVRLTAGAGAGEITVSATAAGLSGSPVSFDARAVTASAVAVTGGNMQSGRTSQSLAQALAVRVTAADGGPVPGATVTWAVTAGGGALSAATTTTDGDGRTSANLTLGGAVGQNTVTATAGATAQFSATATAPVSVRVDMLNIAFVAPGGGDQVTIMLGDTVLWINQDNVQHTATSASVPAGASGFASGLLNQGGSFSFVPTRRGDWVYFCEVHPAQMQGAIITVQ